ncbi:MAG: flagellar hook protein FlgE [Thermodesulfobacteriota bacterium]|nr:flagellar hook protein FlgE [Thermodesulfobacteriota bacterium]
MSISSSLFSGISGLSTNGNAMSVLGDNIANVNTIGFKASRTTFQDVLSQSVATAAGTSQVGRGTTLSSVDTLFQQGSFESTSNATDLAIGGNGFFIVSPRGTDTEYYTRAGQFRFDKDGNFVNPAGYVARGWSLDDAGSDMGTIQDIVLNDFTSPPQATQSIETITNLDTSDTSHSNSLFGAWDATASEVIGDSSYGYQTAVRVYDALGNSHDVTTYFDKMDASSEYDDGSIDLDNSWEYIVCCNPDNDQRSGFAGTAQDGVLMRGTVTYNSSTGDLQDFSAYTCDPAADPTSAANWTTSAFSTDGYPEFTANFVPGVSQSVDVKMGVRNSGTGWDAGNAANVGAIAPGNGVASISSHVETQALTSTQYASSSTTVYQTQDGYGTGFLENISVDTDGIMTGNYSNGQILNLYRVALAKFNNEQALHKEGGNLWAATRATGTAITGHAGENGLGKISPNSLEQSNVDIAAEFVKMITTQRGFQANSRVITTTDSMLQELINLKR